MFFDIKLDTTLQMTLQQKKSINTIVDEKEITLEYLKIG